MSFEVTVVEFPEKHLVGMKVGTSMQKAQMDCPALWQIFGLRINEIPAKDGRSTGSYGLSIMTSESDFDYWAAVEADPKTTIPADMGTIGIPGGLYAKSTIANLSQLSEAFTFVYGDWIQSQSEYALNLAAPCFEIYHPNWQWEDTLDIYVPVMKK